MARAIQARSLAALGEREHGLAILREYLATRPAEPSALKALTIMLAESNQHHEAIAVLREVFRLHPHDMGLANLLAWRLRPRPRTNSATARRP